MREPIVFWPLIAFFFGY